jgi:hypothetical protein
MPILELVRTRPDWFSALEVALTRPEGVPERRFGENHWDPKPIARPRRVSDDLAWFRHAVEDPEAHGLHPIDDDLRLHIWEAAEDEELRGRLERLQQRGILAAAGFLLHDPVKG